MRQNPQEAVEEFHYWRRKVTDKKSSEIPSYVCSPRPQFYAHQQGVLALDGGVRLSRRVDGTASDADESVPKVEGVVEVGVFTLLPPRHVHLSTTKQSANDRW